MTHNFSPKTHIKVENAHMHNLQHVFLEIPKNKLIVFTGVSGSGKSSLAFDTIYAEGQRRYVESLSSYARQFLGRLEKPLVDDIKGLTPAIAIEQKVHSNNPRSTVGTVTEIYDYLKLLFARIGETHSPISGQIVKKQTVTDVITALNAMPIGQAVVLASPWICPTERSFSEHLRILQMQGYTRLMVDQKPTTIADLLDFGFEPQPSHQIWLVIDRFHIQQEESFWHRVADSIQTAFFEGHGQCMIWSEEQGTQAFDHRFSLDGIDFMEPSVGLFGFNNPQGACPKCEGFGKVLGVDSDLVIANPNLSVFEQVVVPWRSDKMQQFQKAFILKSNKDDFPIHKPYKDLSKAHKQYLWKAIDDFFAWLESKVHQIQYRVMLSKYRGTTVCPSCEGGRLRPEATYVRVGGFTMAQWVSTPLEDLQPMMEQLSISPLQQKIADRLLNEITSRLKAMNRLGLGYLTLNRGAGTLSGGEFQRMNLATSLGSPLVGSTYVLDEPSIGLHSKDTQALLQVLIELRDLGNTVMVVEHDEDVVKLADWVIDVGPLAGVYGGHIQYSGPYEQFEQADSLTAQYIRGLERIDLPTIRRPWQKSVNLNGVFIHNLKNIQVEIPLGVLVVVSGVSGSGKSTLVRQILAPVLAHHLGEQSFPKGLVSAGGQLDAVEYLEVVDQNPIGKSSRSNPATYIKAYDAIRDAYANTKLSKLRGYKPKHFSFNVDGGRCDECQGEGEVLVEMQFMADLHLKCESCQGQRFKSEILEVNIGGLNIYQLLNLSVDGALAFFNQHGQPKIVKAIQPLADVGLGYLSLGQSSSTLSGGEAQRVKLASFLAKGTQQPKTLFIFDEPSTGLHFHDIKKLLQAFNALINMGHSVVVIEHNLDIIKCADWVIDMGPGAGVNGGYVVANGTPEQIIQSAESVTAKYLKEKMKMDKRLVMPSI